MSEMNVNSPTANWTEKDWIKFTIWLKDMLKVGPATVTFTKKDGSERVMQCTLEPNRLPETPVTEGKKERKVSNDTLAVYDLEANGWRSFTIKSVKRVQFSI